MSAYIVSTAMGSSSQLVRIKNGENGGKEKLEYLDEKSRGGRCYLQLFRVMWIFMNQPIDDFKVLVDELVSQLGVDADASDVIAMYVKMFRVLSEDLSDGEFVVDDRMILRNYQQITSSRGRFRWSENDGVVHLDPSEEWTGCDCDSPVCEHGYNLRFIFTATVPQRRRIGASGFDMGAFMGKGISIESTVSHDSFATSLPPPPPVTKVRDWQKKSSSPGKQAGGIDKDEVYEAAKRMSEAHDKDRILPYTDKYLPEKEAPKEVKPNPKSVLLKVRKRLAEMNSVEEPELRPVQSPKIGVHHDGELTLGQEVEMLRMKLSEDARVAEKNAALLRDLYDSKKRDEERHIEIQRRLSELSSQAGPSTIVADDSISQTAWNPERRRRYINEGTVIHRVSAKTMIEQASGRERTVVSDGLIRGYIIDDDARDREQRIVSSIGDINGLTAPFKNDRLNFLANFHTGMRTALSFHDQDPVRSLFSFMKRTHIIPYDKLTKVVLSSTIDRSEGLFSANPFNLPYLEIGMLVSEDAIRKVIDLTYSNYKELWFQEMKGLEVPSFHSLYSSFNRDLISADQHHTRERARPAGERQERRERASTVVGKPSSRRSPRTILGF